MTRCLATERIILLSLATIAREPSADGKPRPVVRCVDAYYEDCTFYVVTYGKSNKMLQIEQNAEVSIASLLGDVYCHRNR